MKTEPINLVSLAVDDLTVAASLLRKPRGGVRGLDVRHLAGGATALALGDTEFDTYCGAVDAGLAKMRGLRNHGHIIERSEIR